MAPNLENSSVRLTAYVLGELSEAERLVVERELAHSPEARGELAELQATSSLLFAALQSEPTPPRFPAIAAALLAAAEQSPPEQTVTTVSSYHPPRARAGFALVSIVVAAAAMLLVLCSLPNPSERTLAWNQPQAVDYQAINDFAWSGLADGRSTPGVNHFFPHVPGKGGGGRPSTVRYDSYQEGQSGAVVRGNGRAPGTNVPHALGRQIAPQTPAVPNQSVGVTTTMPSQHPGTATGKNVSHLTTSVAGLNLADAVDPNGHYYSLPLGAVQTINTSERGNWPKSTVNGLSLSTPVLTPVQTLPGVQRRGLNGINSNTALNPNTGNPYVYEFARNTPPPNLGDLYSLDYDVISNLDQYRHAHPTSQESYAPIVENLFLATAQHPVSTFSIDVDTASYTNVRRYLTQGQWPPADAVRLEELINYFPVDTQFESKLPFVQQQVDPLEVILQNAKCPWAPEHQLVRIALKAKELDLKNRPPASLTFLVDVSGSMQDEKKLPLLQKSLNLLVEQMTAQDRLAIVTYSDTAKLVLDSTSGQEKDRLREVIDALHAGGSTNGAAGIQLAYATAQAQFSEKGQNRVILCTDGDFNVGVSDDEELVKMIEEKRKSGVFLSIFGFGMGNLKDAKLEKLADKGNGHYAYIDALKEARRCFVEELTGTLFTVAKDVKLQIDFNPETVGAYRLLGYENRVMAKEDFQNDKVDAGEIGAGHRVVALYELAPKTGAGDRGQGTGKIQEAYDALRKQFPDDHPAVQELRRLLDAAPVSPPVPNVPSIKTGDASARVKLMTLKLRFKQPRAEESTLHEIPLELPTEQSWPKSAPTGDMAWAANVASFGMLLRGSQFSGNATFDSVLETAQANLVPDPHGQKQEFVQLVTQAKSLWTQQQKRLAEVARAYQNLQPTGPTPNSDRYVPPSPYPTPPTQAPYVTPDYPQLAPFTVTPYVTPVPQPTRPKGVFRLLSSAAREKAMCQEKYKELLDKISVPQDAATYGEFHDYGWWTGTNYAGRTDLPPAHWVYVAPDWYLWGELAHK